MWHWLETVAQASAILLHARAHAMPTQAETLAALQQAYFRMEAGLARFQDAEREVWRGLREVRCLNHW